MLRFTSMASLPAIVYKVSHEELQKKLYKLRLDLSDLNEGMIYHYTDLLALTAKASSDYIVNLSKVAELSFATCIQPLVNLQFAAQKSKYTIMQAAKLHTDISVKNASIQATKLIYKVYTDLLRCLDLYNVFNEYLLKYFPAECANLTFEDQSFVKQICLAYKLEGLGLKFIDQWQTVALISDIDDELEFAYPKIKLTRQTAIYLPMPSI
jgi:hypothetical protein